MTGVAAVDVQQAHDMMEAGEAVLIDVREPDEFAAARIEGAILAPLSQMPQAWLELDLPVVNTGIAQVEGYVSSGNEMADIVSLIRLYRADS